MIEKIDWKLIIKTYSIWPTIPAPSIGFLKELGKKSSWEFFFHCTYREACQCVMWFFNTSRFVTDMEISNSSLASLVIPTISTSCCGTNHIIDSPPWSLLMQKLHLLLFLFWFSFNIFYEYAKLQKHKFLNYLQSFSETFYKIEFFASHALCNSDIWKWKQKKNCNALVAKTITITIQTALSIF